MVNPTLCTNPSCNIKGQPKLALFFALAVLYPPTGWGQTTLQIGHEQWASSGYLKAEHWLNKSLKDTSTQWIAAQTTVKIDHPISTWSFSMGRTRQGFLEASTNALLVSAENEVDKSVDLHTPGRFDLAAQVWQLDATTLAAKHRFKPTESVHIEIEPYIQTVHDFQFSQGRLTLNNQSTVGASQLMGSVERTGTRHYGYLINDRPDNGWGMGLNLSVCWESSLGSLNGSFRNLANRLTFSTIHHSKVNYNISATGDQINIADLPSISGSYDISSAKQSVPIFWDLSFTPASLQKASLGMIGVGHRSAWTAAFTYTQGDDHYWVRTVGNKNWTLGFNRKWISGWSAGLAASWANASIQPAITKLTLLKSW